MTDLYWTPARLDELERLWEAGASDEDLMRRFNKSRYAIENQRWKLKLPKGGQVFASWDSLPADAFR